MSGIKGQKGHKMTKKITNKIVATRRKLGNYKHTEETKRIIAQKKIGFKYSDEAKRNMGLSHVGNKSTLGKTGSEANNWRGGKTPEYRRLRSRKEWGGWRIAVFERDDWTCQKCGERGVHLHPHHILNHFSHADLVFEVDNGITLCKRCHYRFHSACGFRDNNQEQIINFIRNGG